MASSFLQRWSQRKLEDVREEAQPDSPSDSEAQGSNDSGAQPSTSGVEAQQDTPAPGNSSHHSLDESSGDIAALLSSDAEQSIKKLALRQLFQSGAFSDVDNLNDYDHNFKAVKSLSSDVVSQLRDWMGEQDKASTSDPIEEPPEAVQADTSSSDLDTHSDEELPETADPVNVSGTKDPTLE